MTGDLVRRSRLHEQLDIGLQTPVTLVAAPAGYGKSTLVSHWAESRAEPCAWVSLDEGDSDLGMFLSYVLAAVQSAVPGACAETAGLLGAAKLPPVAVVARTLANELDDLDAPIVLALDDYHRISGESEVHELLSRLLEHPSPMLRLVITTRRDPPLSLGALRAAGRLTEVRLQDLRFTAPETADLLAATGDVAVGEEALDNLQREIEGWAVGLRLLVLALRHVDDPDSFLRDLRGGLPHTQQYLLREVLAALQPEVREGMLKASILDRFCPKLLDAVCAPEKDSAPGGLSGAELVHVLQQGHLFTIPLDARGEWFRYHHLLRELLRGLLRENTSTSQRATLHANAGAWFESRGLITDAIEHALAAGEAERAARIVERFRQEEFEADRWRVVERWLALLPVASRQERPVLVMAQGWIDSCHFRLERLPATVERVERLLEGRALEPNLLGELAFFRGSLQFWGGDAARSIPLFEEALLLLAGSGPHVESNTELLLALARCMEGQPEQAIHSLQQRLGRVPPPSGQRLGHLIGGLAFVHLLSGRLIAARTEAQRLQEVGTRSGHSNNQAWAAFLSGCTHLHCHDLPAATRWFGAGAEHLYVIESRLAADMLAGLALTQQLQGQVGEARETIDRLEEYARGQGNAASLAVARSCKSRVSLLQGDSGSAFGRAGPASDSHTPGELLFWLEVPAVTRARMLVATASEASLAKASELLTALRRQCEEFRFTNHVIEVSVLQALALEKQGRVEEARKGLVESVALARPGGWIRPFVEAGPAMAEMLERLRGQDDIGEFVARVLAAFEEASAPRGPAAPADPEPAPARAARTSPVGDRRPLEDLTNRELDILELLSQRLQNKEIAERLSISPQTVNYHLKHIYQKLETSGRRQTVARAVERGILTRPSGG